MLGEGLVFGLVVSKVLNSRSPINCYLYLIFSIFYPIEMQISSLWIFFFEFSVRKSCLCRVVHFHWSVVVGDPFPPGHSWLVLIIYHLYRWLQFLLLTHTPLYYLTYLLYYEWGVYYWFECVKCFFYKHKWSLM